MTKRSTTGGTNLARQLQAITQALVCGRPGQEVVALILDALVATTACERLLLLATDAAGPRPTPLASRGHVTPQQMEALVDAAARSDSVIHRALSERRTLHLRDGTGGDSGLQLPEPLRSELAAREVALVPVVLHDRPLGLLWLDAPQTARPLTESMLESAGILAHSLALAIEGLTQPSRI